MCAIFQLLVVLALIAVAAAQYLPYAYNGLYRSGHYGGYANAPLAYSGLGYRGYGYTYPYLG